MGRRVRAFQSPPATLVEFGEQIIAIWDNLNQADVLSTINSMGRRCEAIIHAKATEPFSLVYFVEAVVTIFLFFLINSTWKRCKRSRHFSRFKRRLHL
jgi:hypothetical protein